MVAPHGELLQAGHGAAGFGGQLGCGAVVIQTQHGGEIRRVHAAGFLGGVHGDQRVGVAGVAHHQHLHVGVGVFTDGLALNRENGAIGFQQISAFHAFAAGAGTNQQAHLCVLERGVGIIGGEHAGQQWEGAVFQFHDHPLAGLLGLRQVEQLQDHGLILAQHFAAGDAEQEAITDLAGGAGDRDSDGGFGHFDDSSNRHGYADDMVSKAGIGGQGGRITSCPA